MSTLQINKYKSKLNFAIPLMAIAGLGAIGVLAVDQDVDESVFASNSTTVTGTFSYDDEYITISNNSVVDFGTSSITADSSYVYATDNVTVSTNVASGYELYLSSANNESAALTTPSSYTTIAATSGTGGDSGTPKALDRNSYGYAVPSGLINNTNFDVSYASPTSNSKFAGVPVGTSDRIHSTNAANESGDVTEVHYAANVTNALAPGTYTGQVIYSAVVTPTSGTYTMSVSPSSGASLSTTITVTSGPTTIATDASLDPSEVQIEFRQNGKTKGTCEVTKVDVSSGHLVTTCLANAPAETYDVTVLVPRFGFKDTKTSGFTVTSSTPTLKGLIEYHRLTTMQDLTTSLCSEAATWASTSEDITLKDSRDNSTYTIRKLADGHCWMVQNLRLMNKTISSSDSDISSSSFTIPASSEASSSGNGNWCADGDNSTCVDRRVAQYNDNTTYGAYYNWYTATAGTGTYSMSSGDATSSICPKGWKLPLGTTADYSWKYLYNKYGKASTFQAATLTGSDYLAGYVYNGSLNYDGSYGYWWSRTASSKAAFSLFMNGSSVDPQNYHYVYKYLGYSVRCVLSS